MSTKQYESQIQLNYYDYKYFNEFMIKFNKIKKTYKKKKIPLTLNQNFVKTKQKIFTVLKSPHVNKKSQEKFKQSTYKINFTITSTKVQPLYEIANIIYLISDFQSKVTITQKK